MFKKESTNARTHGRTPAQSYVINSHCEISAQASVKNSLAKFTMLSGNAAKTLRKLTYFHRAKRLPAYQQVSYSKITNVLVLYCL